jgi:hypothetical protein
MVGAFAHSAINGNVACSVLTASFACFDLTGQICSTASFHENKFPAFVKNLLDMFRHVYNLVCRNNVVVSLDISVIHLLEPERVLGPFVFFNVVDLRAMQDATFPSKRSEWASIGVHRGEYDPHVARLSLNVPWAVKPVHSEALDGGRTVAVCGIFGRQEFHNARKVVGFAGWLADQIHMV